jgi:glycosyltransferase involved in cell wall biosynthesis
VGEVAAEVFHSSYGALRGLIDELGIADRVVFTGFLPDEDLVVLLNRATLLALPSLLEGFGLPAVEAAACGCPVLATRASPLPELLGQGGWFLDPLDQESWDSALLTLLTSPERRQRMREAGLAAAGRLTWESAADQLLAVIEEVSAQ